MAGEVPLARGRSDAEEAAIVIRSCSKRFGGRKGPDTTVPKPFVASFVEKGRQKRSRIDKAHDKARDKA